MDSFPEFLSNTPSQYHRVKGYLDQFNGEIFSLLSENTQYVEKIKILESEISAYKRAYADVDAERRQYEIQMSETKKQKADLESQLQGFRIVTLIDGDGAIFSKELISQGQVGGFQAAQKLSDSIIQYLTQNHGAHEYQVRVYIFLNKRGLMDALGRLGSPALKASFEDFMIGFNQATERFMMLDVGNAKEAADTKIKRYLEDDIRLPQTFKVIFGGCHDNGYVTNLRSQITAGYKDKLIFLKSYAEMAAGISELNLPTMNVPDLFLSQKLGSNPSADAGTPEVITNSPRPISYSSITKHLPTMVVSSEVDGPMMVKQSSTSATSVAAFVSRREPTPELDSSDSSMFSESDYGDGLPRDAIVSALASGPSQPHSRFIDPDIPLWKHQPPPCTLFYLASCKHGVNCKYGHDYYLEAEHYEIMRINAKKAPCPAVNRGEVCTWGTGCCYGHVCPSLGKCHFYKQGRCKFTAANMHKEQTA